MIRSWYRRFFFACRSIYGLSFFVQQHYFFKSLHLMHRPNNDHDEFISCSMHVAMNEGSSEFAASHATVSGARRNWQRVQTRRLRADFFLRIYMTFERYLGRLLPDPDDDNPGSNSRSRSSSSQWWWDCLVAPPSGSWLSSKLRRTCIGPVSIEAKRNIRRHILIKSIGKLPCGLQHSSRGAVKRLTPLWWMPRQASNMVLFCTTWQHLLLLNYSIDGGSYFADTRHACFI